MPRQSWAPAPRPLTLSTDPRGLYRYDPGYEEEVIGFQKRGPYSFWSAVKYIFILSLMLWWIPTFGQMIAGYVGGRKAGNHWKAAAAAIFPVALIWILSLFVEATSSFPELANLFALPTMAAYGVAQAVPVFAPYINFTVDYLTAFAIALKGTVTMGLNGYLVTIIFAYIGGLVADQMSRERRMEAEDSPPLSAPAYERTYPAFEAPMSRPRMALPAGTRVWYRDHRERYDHYRRIPVTPYMYEEQPVEYYDEPPPRVARSQRPVQRRAVERYQEEEYEGEPEEVVRPARRRKKLDKEELIRRLVERAIRDYDRSIR